MSLKGIYTKESDVDVFVISDKKINTSSIIEATNMVGREISLKSANRQQFLEGLRNNDPLIKEVVSNHIILKGEKMNSLISCSAIMQSDKKYPRYRSSCS